MHSVWLVQFSELSRKLVFLILKLEYDLPFMKALVTCPSSYCYYLLFAKNLL